MKCELALNQITDYVEGRVDAPMRVVLDHHFAECPSCREELQDARELADLFRGLPQVEPPLGFRARVLARVDAESPRRIRWLPQVPAFRSGRRLGLYAGGAVAVLALVMTTTPWGDNPMLGLDTNPLTSWIKKRVHPDAQMLTVSNLPEIRIAGSPLNKTASRTEVRLNIVLEPKSNLNNGRVTITNMSVGLTCETAGVPTERGRVIWQGSMDAGGMLSLPLRLKSTEPKVQQLLVHVEGDWQDYQRLVHIPFGEKTKTSPESVLQGTWSTSETLEHLAQRFGVVIATDLTHQRPQATALQLTHAGQAVDEVARQRGMELTFTGGVYNVYDSGIPRQ